MVKYQNSHQMDQERAAWVFNMKKKKKKKSVKQNLSRTCIRGKAEGEKKEAIHKAKKIKKKKSSSLWVGCGSKTEKKTKTGGPLLNEGKKMERKKKSLFKITRRISKKGSQQGGKLQRLSRWVETLEREKEKRRGRGSFVKKKKQEGSYSRKKACKRGLSHKKEHYLTPSNWKFSKSRRNKKMKREHSGGVGKGPEKRLCWKDAGEKLKEKGGA